MSPHHNSSCSIPEVPYPGVLVVCRLLSVSLGGVALGGGEEASHQLAETVHPEHSSSYKYVVKHKSAKLLMTYAVGKLEAALNISHLIVQAIRELVR